MSRMTNLDNKVLGTDGPNPVQAWMRRYGWSFLLVLGVVALVRSLVFANSKNGYVDPFGFGLAALCFAFGVWWFSRRKTL